MTIVIKRFQNKKFYNTQYSRYVTLTEISKMIKEGKDVQVICNRSKVDITNQILMSCLIVDPPFSKEQIKSMINGGKS